MDLTDRLIAHVLTFQAYRRSVIIRTMQQLGVTDLGCGDPMEWEARLRLGAPGGPCAAADLGPSGRSMCVANARRGPKATAPRRPASLIKMRISSGRASNPCSAICPQITRPLR